MASSSDRSVEEFVNLTGAPVEVARGLLEACCGNLELAIGMHLDGSTAPPPPPLQKAPEVPEVPNNSTAAYEEIHGVRAPIPQTQGVLIEQEAPRRTFRRRKLPTSVFDPFQDFSELQSSSSKKHQTLAELFKPPTDIMYQGTFQEARRSGQVQLKWLLVNLQDSSEFKCQVLNRDVWRNTSVRKIVRDHFIFIQMHRITDDGAKFQQLYNLHSYPSVIIIDPRTGEEMAKLTNLSLSSFLSEVQDFLAFNSLNYQKDSSSHTESWSVYNQSENEQLQAAIRASMKDTRYADSDSDVLLSPEGLATDTEESLRTESSGSQIVGLKRKTDDTTMEDDEYHQPSKHIRLEGCSSNLSGSSTTLLADSGHGSSDKDTTCLLVRYPDGRRSVKSFHIDHPIKELFSYLNEEGIDLSQYEVITTFPRIVVSSLPQHVTFREAKLHPRQTVHVQLAYDDDE